MYLSDLPHSEFGNGRSSKANGSEASNLSGAPNRNRMAYSAVCARRMHKNRRARRVDWQTLELGPESPADQRGRVFS